MAYPSDASSPPPPRRRLGEILVAGGAITDGQLRRALAEQATTRLPLGQTLLTLGLVTDEIMRRALGSQLGVPFIDLDNVIVDRALAQSIDPEYALEHLVLPIAQVGGTLTVAMDDPTAGGVVEELERQTGFSVSPVTSSAAAIRHTLKRLYASTPGEPAGKIAPGMDIAEYIRRRSEPAAERHACMALLGLNTPTFDAVWKAVAAGLSVGVLDRFTANSGIKESRITDVLRLTGESLAARRRTGRLTSDESDRMVTVAHSYGLALDLFAGDPALATAWLQSRQPSLDGAVPLDLARTMVGAREVDATLGRLVIGSGKYPR